MGKKDKILDRLLQNQDVEQPSKDFTNDIMQMISGDFADVPLDLAHVNNVEQAPKHMTDLVMDAIVSTEPKTYTILSTSEKTTMFLLSIGILALCIFSVANDPTIIVVDSNQIIETVNSFLQSLDSWATLMLIIGTALWITDHLIRQKFRPA